MDTNIDRTWTRHPTSTGIGVDHGSVCAHCGLRSPPGSAQGALLPDDHGWSTPRIAVTTAGGMSPPAGPSISRC